MKGHGHALYRVACQAGLVVPFVADLAGGVSMAWWQERARVYATTPAEAVAMLALMDEEFERRVAWMFARGVKVLDPSPDWPHLRAFVDEAPELANDKEGQRLVGKALRQWAKAGMAIDVASQVGHAAVTWGRDVGTAMSEQIANVWAFRAGVQTSRIVMHGTEMDLSQLPRGVPGASFLWTPDHPEPVMVRGRWDREPDASWLDVPRWSPGAPAPRVPEQAAPVVRDGPAQDRIVAALAGGPMTEAAIVAATGLGKTIIFSTLAATLGDHGVKVVAWSTGETLAADEGMGTLILSVRASVAQIERSLPAIQEALDEILRRETGRRATDGA